MYIVDTDNATLTCGERVITFRKTIMGVYGWITPYAVHIPGTPLLVKRNEGQKLCSRTKAEILFR